MFDQTPAAGPAFASPGVAAEIRRARAGERRKRIRGVLYGLVISGALLGYGYGRPDGPAAGFAVAVGIVFVIVFLVVIPARLSLYRQEGRRVRELLRTYPWVQVRFRFEELEHPDGYPLEGLRLFRADGSTLIDVRTPWSSELRQLVRESPVSRLWCAGDPETGAVIALPGAAHAFVYTPDALPSRALTAARAGHDPHAGVPAGVDPAGLVLPARRGVRLVRIIVYNLAVLAVLAIVGALTRVAGDGSSVAWSYGMLPMLYGLLAVVFAFIPLTVPEVRIDTTGITRTSVRGKVAHLPWGELTDVEFIAPDLVAYPRGARPGASPAGYMSVRTDGRIGTLVLRERVGLGRAERAARRAALTAALPYFAWTVARSEVRIGRGEARAEPDPNP
ncbi:hypothetical protein [Embleya sp. NBC_00896]|uniref:hypothetical protein n=1 Tax=Embleya sp. NBC_00896 TaxID=2975961 RepID=UPI0038641537|nr:hypothetical protein OG928_26395 [Embleya sp. NBC_00896]